MNEAQKMLVELQNGRFIQHDGGKHDGRLRLSSILPQADTVVCALNCVSHDAANRVKQFCKRSGKQFVFLPRSSLMPERDAMYTETCLSAYDLDDFEQHDEAVAVDCLKLEISADTLLRLMVSGQLCATDIRCLDCTSKTCMWKLLLKSTAMSIQPVVREDDPSQESMTQLAGEV